MVVGGSGPLLSHLAPDPQQGYWSPGTASVDWCEANYAYTAYVAELFNVLSMLPMLVLSVVGNVLAVRYRYGTSFVVVYSLLGVIALGSALFHATLHYSGQVMDELPMIWGTVAGLFIVLERGERTAFPWLAEGLVLYCVGFTACYFLTPEYFFLFLVSYVGGLVAVALLSYRVLQEKRCAPHQSKLVLSSVSILLFGGVLWLLENLHCPALRGLHLHAIFHVTCAAGPHLWLCFAAFDRLQNVGRKPVLINLAPGVPAVAEMVSP